MAILCHDILYLGIILSSSEPWIYNSILGRIISCVVKCGMILWHTFLRFKVCQITLKVEFWNSDSGATKFAALDSSEIFPLDYSCMGHSVTAVTMQFFVFCVHMLAYVLSTGDRSSLPFLSPHEVCKMHPWKTWNFSMRNSSDSTWKYETWCRHRNQVCTSRLCSIWDGRGGSWKIRWIAGLYSQFQWHSGWLYRSLQEYKRFENLLPRSPPVSIIFLLLLEGRSYFSYIVRPRMDCHHAPHEERSFSSELWSSLKTFFSHQYSVISLCKICVSAFLCTGKFHVPAFHLKIHEEIHASLACWSVNVWSRIPKPSSCVFIVPSHGDVSVRKSSFVAQDAVFLPPWFSNFKVSRKRKKNGWKPSAALLTIRGI